MRKIPVFISACTFFISACTFFAIACQSPVNETKTDDTGTGTYTVFSQSVRQDMENCGLDQGEFERLLSLPQKAFDQDFNGGWRAISYQDGCEDIAAEMIKAYILYSEPVPPTNIGILRWHTAQTKAGAGFYNEAIALMRGTYKKVEAPLDNADQWNLYVDGSIAFLEGNKPALQAARDKLASAPVTESMKASRQKFLKDNPNITMPENFIDAPQNLAPLNSLLLCWGQSYSKAYGHCAPQ